MKTVPTIYGELFVVMVHLSVILFPKSPGSFLYFAPARSFELCISY